MIEKGKFGKYLSGIEKEQVIKLFENEINKMIDISDEMKSNQLENNDYRLNIDKDTFEMSVEKVEQLNFVSSIWSS